MGAIFTLQTPIWRIVSPPPLLPFFFLFRILLDRRLWLYIHRFLSGLVRHFLSFLFFFFWNFFPSETYELLMFKSNLFIDWIWCPAGLVPPWFIPFHLSIYIPMPKRKNEIEEQSSSNNFLFSLELRLSCLDSFASINKFPARLFFVAPPFEFWVLSLSSPFVCSHDQSPCADNTQTTDTHTQRKRRRERERENQESGPAVPASQPAHLSQPGPISRHLISLLLPGYTV